MQCPKCQVELKQTDLGEYGLVILDVCEKCKGAWFDKGELDRLDESVWTNVEEHEFHEVAGDHPTATCPKCEAALSPVSPADEFDLIIDRCLACGGFWLDAGELDRMITVAGDADSELLKQGVDITGEKPPEWSWIRWKVHLFKKCYFGDGN